MLCGVICFGSSDRASQPFPFVNTLTGCFSPFRSRVSGYDLSSETCISLCRPLEMINTSASLQRRPRVSELTYVTIVGTRYPELDTFQNDIIQFGNYLQGEQCTRGGFLPIFWDAPYSYIHASTDIGEVVDWIKGKFLVTKEGNKYLAVLHNRNKMVNAFASTEWVAGSEGAVLSRSVTSCAGMTAYLVLLAQTRVGFLSGGRGKTFHQLTQQEQMPRKKKLLQEQRWPLPEPSRYA